MNSRPVECYDIGGLRCLMVPIIHVVGPVVYHYNRPQLQPRIDCGSLSKISVAERPFSCTCYAAHHVSEVSFMSWGPDATGT